MAHAASPEVAGDTGAGARRMGAPNDAPPPSTSPTARLWGYAAVGVQLALVLLIVHRYDVAARNHFFAVLCAAACGFVVHACLPPRFRLAFFCLLSLGVLLKDIAVVIVGIAVGGAGFALEIVLGEAAIKGLGSLL